MPRLFVALELPTALREAVAGLQSGLPNARWLKPDSLHLTFAFIGEVDPRKQQAIETALGTVTAPAFRMKLQGVGCFPPRGAPRVLWTGASPETELASLAGDIRIALGSLELTSERRPFLPHVTIARFKRPPSDTDLATYLDAHSIFETPSFEIGSFHLFSSELRPTGARYTLQTSIPLAGTSHHRC